jgi:hypothetical protein
LGRAEFPLFSARFVMLPNFWAIYQGIDIAEKIFFVVANP